MSSSVQVLEHELLAHLVPVYHHVAFSLCSVSGCTPMVFNVTWKCYICQNHPHSLSTILDCLLFIFSVFHLTFLFRKTTICYLWYFFPNMCCMRSYLAQASAKEKKKVQNCQSKIFCCSCCSLGLAYCGWHLGAGLLLFIKRCAFYKWEHCYMTIRWKIHMKIEYLYFYNEIPTWYQQQSSYLAGLTLFSLPQSGIEIPCFSLGFCIGKRNMCKQICNEKFLHLLFM